MIEQVRRSPAENKQTLGSWDLRIRRIIAGSGDIGTRAKQDWWTGGRSRERCGIG